MRKIVDLAALVLTSLVMGVFWGTWFTLTRSLSDFSPAEFIHIGKVIIANVGGPMSVIMPATLIVMLAATWLAYRGDRTAFYFYALSFLLMIVTLVITLTVLVPIDNQIATWTPETIPPDWQTLRARWDTFHTARTFTSIASLTSLAWGTLGK